MGENDRAYREELAAAHARIASLEAELASRKAPATDKRIRDLDAQRDKLQETIEPERIRKVALLTPFVTASLFGVLALLAALGGPKPELIAIPIAGAVLGGLISLLHAFVNPKSVRAQIAKLDEQIAEIRRITALEEEVRETRRLIEHGKVRVAGDVEELEADEPQAERQSQR
jgi:hypothetical protein